MFGLSSGVYRELRARMEAARGEPIADSGLFGLDMLSARPRAGLTCRAIRALPLVAARVGLSRRSLHDLLHRPALELRAPLPHRRNDPRSLLAIATAALL
jgi:hypothetical protein